MIERLTRSLSFRLLAIFLVLAAAFIYFANIGIRWVYQEDDLRELISGHLSLADPSVRPLEFFSLDRSGFLAAVATQFTYLIVLLQFRQAD